MTHKLQYSSSTIIFILFLTVIVVMASSKFAFGHSSMWDFGINYHVAVDLFNRGTVSRMFDWHVLGLMPLYGFFDVFGDLGPYSIIALQSTFVFTGLYFAMESLPDFFHNPRWSLFFLLFPPIWFNLLFDIRWDPLIIIVLGLFYYTAQKPGNGFFLFLLGVMACLIKEVFALSAIAMGMYLLLHSANRRIYVGSLLILFGISYFLFVGNVVMPFFNGQSEATDLWNKAFGYLGNGFGEMLVNLVTHPWILVTEVISTPKKLFFIVFVFGPFLFIPLLAPLELLPALPLLAISLLSHDPNHYGYAHQYTAGMIVPTMVSFGIGLERLRAKIPDIHFKKVIILSFSSMIAFHVLFSPSPISRLFLTDKVWGYGWSAYVPNDRNDRIQAAIRLYIPSDKNIVVSVQNTIVTYDLMRRDNVFVFPDGIFNPAEGRATDVKVLNNFIGYINDKNPPLIYPSFFADYVVVDFKRPLFINDRGCGWQYGKCLDLKHVDKFKKIFSQVVENGEIIWKDDEMYIVHLDRSSKGSNNL